MPEQEDSSGYNFTSQPRRQHVAENAIAMPTGKNLKAKISTHVKDVKEVLQRAKTEADKHVIDNENKQPTIVKTTEHDLLPLDPQMLTLRNQL